VRRFLKAYVCALLAGAALLPAAAGTVTSALYLDTHRFSLNGTGSRSVVVGVGIALAAWLVLAPLLMRFAYPTRAIPSVYDELHAEYDELRARHDGLGAAAPQAARQHLDEVARELCLAAGTDASPDLRWTLATGYGAMWDRLHRAREELVAAVSSPEVAEWAMEARARLSGSKIADAGALVRELEIAVARLEPSMSEYLDADRPPRPPATAPENPAAPAAPSPPSGGDADRFTVRRIMRAIYDYRDSRRKGLVRARNRLFATIIFAGSAAFGILALALLEETKRRYVAAGVAYYLIGAVIGLFQQLRAASAADTVTEEDYGLSTARLIHTPLFSGIAAVAGVALAVLAPLADPAHAQTGTAALHKVFDLATYPAGVVVAAVFGLTPSLLITRLQRQAEQYKADLRGSEAGEKHGGSAGASA
jgi:hypothetical protein